MKVMRLLFALLLIVSFFTGCTAAADDVIPGESVSHSAAPQETAAALLSSTAPAETGQRGNMLHISISVDGALFEAQFLDNESARATGGAATADAENGRLCRTGESNVLLAKGRDKQQITTQT